MNPIAIIFDTIFLIILLVIVIQHWRRGFILSLCGLLALFVAFAGANYITQQLSPIAEEAIAPKIEDAIIEKIDDTLGITLDEDLAFPSIIAIGLLNEYENRQVLQHFNQQIISSAKETIVEKSMTSISEVSHAISASICKIIISPVLFIFFFIIILLLWALISRVLNLAAHLPVIKGFNALLGVLIGLIYAVLFLSFLCWVLSRFSFFSNFELDSSTYVVRFFYNLPANILIRV